MLTRRKQIRWVLFLIIAVAATASAQSPGTRLVQRAPTSAIRPFIVLTGQSLRDIEAKLNPNNVQELIGGEGMQLRVAVQHDKDKSGAAAELHDTSDDVYYVLDGSATLTIGGKLDSPREVEPGEWRAQRITDGKTFEIAKGDLIIVPRGTPHQRSTAGKDFSMVLIKVYAGPLPAPPKASP